MDLLVFNLSAWEMTVVELSKHYAKFSTNELSLPGVFLSWKRVTRFT